MDKIKTLIPLIIYLILNLFIAIYYSKSTKKESFIKEYFIGNRSLGAFVLAMSIIGTYIGASSFIGGPAIAYDLGLGWVLLASIQTPLVFLTLGILGKRLSIIGRKINAVTIIDIIRYRYKNKFLVILLSILMVIFLIASITAQFLGGARLFESILGIDYRISLTIFAFIIIIYTTYGGFKAASISDTLQSVVMLLSTIVLLVLLVYKSGGIFNIMMTLKKIDPNLLTPSSNGKIPINFILSFWILVGIGLLGLPSTTVRAMAYKDTKSMHKAMIIGTLITGFLMINIHLIGVFGRANLPYLEINDKIMPTIAINNLSPFFVGIFIGGPLAAAISSIDSLLILACSSIIKDIYLNYINPNVKEYKIKKISKITSLSIGLITYLIAFNPPSLIVWINLFALAGQQVIFFVPLIFGIYWDKGTDIAALLSVILSFLTYILLSIFEINIYGVHNIVYSLILSILIYVIVSILTFDENNKIEL